MYTRSNAGTKSVLYIGDDIQMILLVQFGTAYY